MNIPSADLVGLIDTDIERECPLHWDTQNPVTLIERNIEAFMAAHPTLPAWAAHQICGWAWLDRNVYESPGIYLDQARAENDYAHSEGAHQ